MSKTNKMEIEFLYGPEEKKVLDELASLGIVEDEACRRSLHVSYALSKVKIQNMSKFLADYMKEAYKDTTNLEELSYHMSAAKSLIKVVYATFINKKRINKKEQKLIEKDISSVEDIVKKIERTYKQSIIVSATSKPS